MQYTGIVQKSTGNFYKVRIKDKYFDCKIRGKYRLKGVKTTNPVAVGDIVDFDITENDDIGVIFKIHQRKNYIIRKSVNLSHQAHIIASNIDYAFLIISLKSPRTHTEFTDRFLVSCEAYSITPVLIFNKFDLYGEDEKNELKKLIKIYENIGYKCIVTSVKHKLNIDKVTELFEEKIIVISGNSGVGKSALINLLNPKLSIKLGEISEYYEQGKHTTTFAEMYPVAGGWVIDTPGIKSFGLFDMDKSNISHYFPEIFIISKNCKYNNCTHVHEPECAVIKAVESEKISLLRYKSYISLISDDETVRYRKDIYKI